MSISPPRSFSFVKLTFARLVLIFACGFPSVAWAQGDQTSPWLIERGGKSAIRKIETPQRPAESESNSWLEATRYPTTICRYAFAQNGQDMYVIGGVTKQNGTTSLVNAVRRYNASTNTWTTLADCPVASEAPVAAYLDGKIYVVDGHGGGNNQIRIYDIATDTWTPGPVKPGFEAAGGAAGAYDGKVYVVIGQTLSIYNIASGTWTVGPGAPSGYFLGGYTQVGQYLYLVGSFGFAGLPGVANSTYTMRLDMATNTWSVGPTWVPQRADFALAAAGTRLIAMGGDTNWGGYYEGSVEVFELDMRTWPAGSWMQSPENLPSPRSANQAGFVSAGRAGGEIWTTGGIVPGDVFFLDEHLFRTVPTCAGYGVTISTGSIVPGAVDIGNHADDRSTTIALPFTYKLYDRDFNSVAAGSNGHLTFGVVENAPNISCLPVTTASYVIAPYWTDQCTGVCSGVNGAGLGIFTSVSGDPPNRIFNIEWRTAYYNSGGNGIPLNYEVRLYEGQISFDVIYGTVNSFAPAQPGNLSVGVQKTDAPEQFTLVGCDATGGSNPPVSSGQLYHYSFDSVNCLPPPALEGFLYVVSGGDYGIYMYGFSVDETSGEATSLPGFPLGVGTYGAATDGAGLAIDQVNRRLYVLDHGLNAITVWSIDPTTGMLTSLPFSPVLLGGGTLVDPYPWNVVAVHPSGSPLIAGDDRGKIRSFVISPTSATEAPPSPRDPIPGSSGLISATFSQDGDFLYGGTSSSLCVSLVNQLTGQLIPLTGSPFNWGAARSLVSDSQGRVILANYNVLQAFTTSGGVPSPVDGSPFPSGLISGAGGVLHPNEQWYFASDINGNQVGSYRVAGTGSNTTLTPVTGSPFASGGMQPRAMAMDRTGTFLFAANAFSSNLTRYRIDGTTGALTDTVVQAPNTLGTLEHPFGIGYFNPILVRTAVSRKTHGSAGSFDINLPLTGTPGVECRVGGVAGEHQIFVSFAAPVKMVDLAAVSSGTATLAGASFSGQVVRLDLRGVANAQTVTVSFVASDGVNTSMVAIPISFLAGDTTGNGAVNSSDLAQTKMRSGQVVSPLNFRQDVMANGAINASDVAAVKSRSGTALP